ncbi:MAG: hypothetical protein AB2768_20915, partial [Candidatus Thiodiazotropha endolucinida]
EAGLIGSTSFIPGLCPITTSDPAIWIRLLYPCTRVERHAARHQIKPYSANIIYRGGRILKHFLISSDTAGDVSRRGNSVFDICQELFLGIKSRPGLENIRPRLGLRSVDRITADLVVDALHTRLHEALQSVTNE